MAFEMLLGMEKETVGNKEVFHREAVRGILLKGQEILLVLTKDGDYKFPGGGIEPEESHEDALRREILEETGCTIGALGRKAGQILERRVDYKDPRKIFEMVSHYYICVEPEKVADPHLSTEERALDFKALWVGIEEAFMNNDKIVKEDPVRGAWVKRETEVLKMIYTRNIKSEETGILKRSVE